MIATRTLRISALGVLVLSSSLTVTAAPAARPATVADLTVHMAVALGFEPAVPVEARRTLLRAGIDLGSDLDSPLTRERANHLLARLGVSAGPPAEPGAPVSTVAVRLIAMTAAEVVMATPAYPAPEVASIEPTCFTLPLNQCVSCCVQSILPGARFPRTLTRYCENTCWTTTQPPSPSVPQ